MGRDRFGEAVMLENLVYNVEAGLRSLGRLLWSADPFTQLQAQAQRVSEGLRQCQQALQQACADRAAAQRRLKCNYDLIAHVPGLIQRCLAAGQSEDAWRHALALDRARQEAAADEAALPRLGQLCWSLHFQVRQLQRRLARVNDQLVKS
jgi:hypothetical protein